MRFGALVAIYSLLRVAFVLLNRGSFPDVPFAAFLGGVRFDLSALAWLNLPWLLMCLISPVERGWFAAAKRMAFHAVNAVGFFFACADIEYFKFTLKRSTADLFGIMAGGNDVASLATVFALDYWHIVLLFVVCLGLAEAGYRLGTRAIREGKSHWARQLGWRVVVIGLVVITTRGGLQLIPIGPMNAADHAQPRFAPVVLNTPFTMLTSYGKPVVAELRYMTDEEADALWPVVHEPASGGTGARLLDSTLVQKPNVVVIILESFSAAYSAKLSGGADCMPFLDSLMGKGLAFTHAYANGRRSIDGIPAITASLPEWMDEALITSSYLQSPFTALGGVLAEAGYATSFYHGGRNGTMGFDTYASAAGYQRYVGMNEYPDAKDYDGNWGIWDRPFLDFFARELGQQQQPFHSVVFTLSSHHPYQLPAGEEARFPQGAHRIEATLRYTDDALRRFFDTARSEPWFRNTLFVVTADHTADLDRTGQQYSEAVDYWVPLVFYWPAAIAPRMEDHIAQHIDILPTVLDITGQSEPYISFGASLAHGQGRGLVVLRSMGYWYGITTEGVFCFNGEHLVPTAVKHPLPLDADAPELRRLKAAIQQFTGRMARNQLTLKREGA
jgi:hypothetical protein